MVRRYAELVKEIQDKQRYTRIDWTQKVIEALQYTMDELQGMSKTDPERLERITYEQWREWQETLAKKYGFSETTDTPPDYAKRKQNWMKIQE